jgi:hypothetical protein
MYFYIENMYIEKKEKTTLHIFEILKCIVREIEFFLANYAFALNDR